MIIICDTETTGLLQPEGNDLTNQPHITEICALKVDNDFNQIGFLETLIKPPVPIPEHITKLTGLTDADIADAPIFAEIYRDLVELFIGCHTFVAHNAPFDIGMIATEMKRIDKTYQFPWPPIHFCTVEQSMNIRGHRLKLAQLHKIATGQDEIKNAHRASSDVFALLECYKYLVRGA